MTSCIFIATLLKTKDRGCFSLIKLTEKHEANKKKKSKDELIVTEMAL
jgi:hypothetical protein